MLESKYLPNWMSSMRPGDEIDDLLDRLVEDYLNCVSKLERNVGYKEFFAEYANRILDEDPDYEQLDQSDFPVGNDESNQGKRAHHRPGEVKLF